MSTEEMNEHFRHVMSKTLREKDSPEKYYLLMMCYRHFSKPDKSLECARTFMERAPLGHVYHGLACYHLGVLQFDKDKLFSEEVVVLFQKAYKTGIALAAKYLMFAHSGAPSHLSLVKWCDPEELVRIAITYPKLQSEYFACLTLNANEKKPEKDDIKKMFHEVRYGLESSEQKAHPQEIIRFNQLLCDLFSKPDDESHTICKDIEGAMDDYAKQFGNPGLLVVLYHYARYKKSKDTASLNALSLLVDVDDFASFCVARIISKNNPCDEKKCIELFTRGFEVLHGYRYLADFYMSLGNNEEALKTCHKAINTMDRFVQGKEKIFYHSVGEQATSSHSRRPSAGHDKTINIEELAAVDLNIRFFQGQIDVLEEAVSEQLHHEAKQPLKTAPLPRAPDDSDSDEEFYTAPAHPSEEDSDSDTYFSANESFSDNSADGFTTVVKRRPFKPSLRHIRQALNNARTQAVTKHYIAAEKILNSLQPEVHSVEWYRKEQALCWIKHLQVTDPEYLTQNQTAEKSANMLANELLDTCEKRTIELIHSLTHLITPEPSSAPLRTDKTKCIRMANKLEAKDPKLRAQYGGLYSVLGHVQKAKRDICTLSADHTRLAHMGITYYTLANHIRKRITE